VSFLIPLVLGPCVALGPWDTFPDNLADFGALGEDSRVTCNIAMDDLEPLGTDLAPACRGIPFEMLSREGLALLRSTVLPDAVEWEGDEIELDGGVGRLSMPLNWRSKDGLLFTDAEDEASLLGGAVADTAACALRSCSALTAVVRVNDPEGCSFAEITRVEVFKFRMLLGAGGLVSCRYGEFDLPVSQKSGSGFCPKRAFRCELSL
jgi:hypothetical protein